MTVHALIEELQKFDQDKRIIIRRPYTTQQDRTPLNYDIKDVHYDWDWHWIELEATGLKVEDGQ